MRSSNNSKQLDGKSAGTPIENGPSTKERLPTIQIDTVPSMPPSPCDSLHEEQEPVDESQIELELTEKLQFADQAEAAVDQESSQTDLSSIPASKEQQEIDKKSEAEIHSTASEVVSEVIDKAIEVASEKMAKEAPSFTFPITYDEAPEDVKEYAANYVKDIVNKALSTAEEKKPPTVPFNFDGDLMKTSGPWYIRAREALVRLLRTACFCTPRRNNS